MTPLYRTMRDLMRSLDFDLMVIPGPNGETVEGLSFCGPGYGRQRRRYITITGDTAATEWLFVLMHEVAHHSLGHTAGYTSVPVWITEKMADDVALGLIKTSQPEAFAHCEALSRAHVGELLQAMIDAEVWHHVDIATAEWAGCVIPPEARPLIEDYASLRHRAADDDIIF